MKSSKLFVVLAGLALAGMLSPAAFGLQRGNSNGNGNGNGNVNGNGIGNGGPENEKFYKATIDPSSIVSGAPATLTFRIGNCQITDSNAPYTYCASASGATQTIGSARIIIPSEFTNPSFTSVTSSGGQSWTGSVVSGNIELKISPGNNQISPGQYLAVVFTANPPVVDCEDPAVLTTWATTVYTGPNFNGDTFTRSGSDPTVTVEGDCNLVGMPVTKFINGEAAQCTAIPDGQPPDPFTGNPDFTRRCDYVQAGLTLLLGDPRFDINAYETVDGLPGQALNPQTKKFDGGLFPQPGPRVPPVFHPSLPAGTELTICERQTYPAPFTNIYTLSKVTITSDLEDSEPENVPIYFQDGSDGNLYACFNIVLPDDGTEELAIDLNNSEVCTYTQGAYGNTGGQGGWSKLNPVFGELYGSGLRVGDKSGVAGFNPGSTPPDGWGMLFTNAQAVADFLPPKGGIPGALTQDYTNVKDKDDPHPANFAAQVTTLQINVDLGGIGNFLIFTGAGNCGNGLTVNQVLADANTALSGLPSTCTIGDLLSLADRIAGGIEIDGVKQNETFHECVANPTLFTPPATEVNQ